MIKIGLLKDDDFYMLLLVKDKRLTFIRRQYIDEDIDINTIPEKELFQYGTDVSKLVKTLYKLNDEVNVNTVVNYKDIIYHFFNNDLIFILNRSNIIDIYFNGSLSIKADFSNDRTKDVYKWTLCSLNNYIKYTIDDKLIFLNDLPYKVIKRY